MSFKLSGLLLFLCLASLADSGGPLFARGFVASIEDMLYEAALLDPATGEEDKPARQALQKRQKELQYWFVSHDRTISRADCKTDQDLANYRDFRVTMANFDLLRLPEQDRRRFIRTVMSSLSGIPAVFAKSLDALGANIPEAVELLNSGCREAVTVRSRYFGVGNTTIGAIYFPAERVIYVNLNYLLERPEAFVDALDHELWHHILVNPSPSRWAENIWWEGFTEMLAEQWRWELGRLDPALAPGKQPWIDYPVQTGLASAVYAENPAAAIRLAAGILPASAVLGKLPMDDIAWHRQLESRMQKWGWKEDDGKPLSLRSLARSDGDLTAECVADIVRHDKHMFRDLVRAITPEMMPKSVGMESRLAAPLRENLEEVRRFCSQPLQEFGKDE